MSILPAIIAHIIINTPGGGRSGIKPEIRLEKLISSIRSCTLAIWGVLFFPLLLLYRSREILGGYTLGTLIGGLNFLWLYLTLRRASGMSPMRAQLSVYRGFLMRQSGVIIFLFTALHWEAVNFWAAVSGLFVVYFVYFYLNIREAARS